MPLERQSITKKFEITAEDDQVVEGYITVGLFEDGRPGELFLTVSKEGSFLRGMLDSFAISVSIGLQQGVPLETFVEKFSHTQFEPSGWTGEERLGRATSVLDYVFRWMGQRFLGQPDEVDGP
jgi:ribonucleoside-diphosphate reductase alpha chain